MSDLAAVVTVTLNPAIDQTLQIPGFHLGEVNRVESSRVDAGGKGINVASVLADLGVPVTAAGFLGEENPALFESHFRQKMIADRFIRIPGATRTGIKIVDAEAGETTDINFPGLTPDSGQVKRLIEAVRQCAAPGCWFVLSGSLPPGLSPDLYSRLMAEIRSQGGRVVLDTSGEPLRQAIPHSPEIVKPNLSELEELAGHALQTPQAVVAAAASLVRKGVALAVVSMGAQGAIFVSREAAVLARPPKVEVKSTVGAGDAMVAGLVYAQLQGLGLEATARLATALGAYSVTRFGAGVDLEQLHGLEQQVQVENAGAEARPAAAGNGD
jgi:1-phosphofructokinase